MQISESTVLCWILNPPLWFDLPLIGNPIQIILSAFESVALLCLLLVFNVLALSVDDFVDKGVV